MLISGGGDVDDRPKLITPRSGQPLLKPTSISYGWQKAYGYKIAVLAIVCGLACYRPPDSDPEPLHVGNSALADA